jgi:hypothetical protein
MTPGIDSFLIARGATYNIKQSELDVPDGYRVNHPKPVEYCAELD